MREILLVAVVAVLCCIAVVKPRVGLFAYVWFALMRPDALAFATGQYALSWYLAAATLLGSARFVGSTVRLLRNPFSVLLLCLQTVFYISSLTALDPSLSTEPMQLQTHVVVMALLQVVLVQTAEQLRNLLLVMGLSLGAVGAKFGLFALVHGGVIFTQGYAGFLADNNNLALAMVMTVGLCWHLRELVAVKWLKGVISGVVAMAAVTVIMTHSRGGLLSLIVVVLMIAFRSKHKAAAIAIFACVMAGAIYLVRDSYFQRMSTLKDPLEESSARNRMLLAKAGLRLAKDYPIMGVGFGSENERQIIGSYLGDDGGTQLYLHNTYLQVLVDSGVIAAGLYATLLFGTIVWLGRSAERARILWPEWQPLPLGIRTALVGFAVGSYFLSRVMFDFAYMAMMSAAAWSVIERGLAHAAPNAVHQCHDEKDFERTPGLV